MFELKLPKKEVKKISYPYIKNIDKVLSNENIMSSWLQVLATCLRWVVSLRAIVIVIIFVISQEINAGTFSVGYCETMGKTEHLKPYQFKKGQSGNPKGRVKKLPNLEKLLIEVLGERKDDIVALHTMLLSLRKRAISGDVKAAEMLLNRAYGKVKDTIEIIDNKEEKEKNYFIFDVAPKGNQWQIFESQKRFIVACIGRQWGKSTTMLIKLFYNALQHKGDYFWISPTYKQAKIFFERSLDNFQKFIKSKNKSDLYVKLSNKSTIHFKTAERPDNLRGFTLSGVVVDEYAMIQPIYKQILAPALSTTNGFCYFISTPKGKNHFYDLYNKALEQKELYDVFSFPSETSSFISKQEIDLMKKELPLIIYKQEILAEFIDNNTSFFVGFDKCFNDSSIDNLPYIKKPSIGNSYVLGLDIAKHEDFTVITILENNSNELVYFERFNKKDYIYIANKVKEISKLYNNALVVFDATGVGEVFKELLDSLEISNIPFVFNKTSKQNIIYNLALGIEKQNISFPKIKELVDELSVFEGYSKDGKLVLSAPSGKHDDIIMSLALAYSRIQEVFDYSKLIIKEISNEFEDSNFSF